MPRVATSADWFASADQALKDTTRTERERQERHDYYMQRGEQAKRAEAIRMPPDVPRSNRRRKPDPA